MKKIYSILLITFLCAFANLQAQSTVGFSYDLDGNMVERKVVIMYAPAVKGEMKDTVSVSDIIGEQKIIIYPNPTRGLFQIAVKTLDSKQKNYYLLYSLSGAKLQQQNISERSMDIDISDFPKGVYLLDVVLGDKVSRWKVIKQ
jgi:hypothetical protein